MRSSITTTTLAILLTAGLLPIAACDTDDAQSSERSAPAPDPAPASAGPKVEFAPAQLSSAATTSAPAVEAPTLPSPPSAAPAPAAGPWQGWVDAEVTRTQAEAPAWFQHVMTAQPKLTRAKSLRLVGPEFEDQSAAPVLLHRYLTANEDPQVRAAVVEALVRTRGAYAAAIVDLLEAESDPLVRVHLVSSLQRVAGSDALAALELGLVDADPQVRIAAAYTAGSHPDGASLAAPMLALLDQVDQVEVQLAAARTLGYLHVDTASKPLTRLLTSTDAELRLASLQAIERIDPVYAKGLGELSVLLGDADARVARAAQKIADH
jgi:hypothetical protein